MSSLDEVPVRSPEILKALDIPFVTISDGFAIEGDCVYWYHRSNKKVGVTNVPVKMDRNTNDWFNAQMHSHVYGFKRKENI